MPESVSSGRPTLSETTESKPAADCGRPQDCSLYYVSTDCTKWPGSTTLPPCCPVRAETIVNEKLGKMRESAGVTSVRINWQLKAVLPIAFVLLNGLLLFLLATVSMRDPERHAVIILAGAGAVAICAVLIIVLAFLIQRPMVELQEKIAEVGAGDLDVTVSFAKRNDEIGDLGRNFNRMVEQLRQNERIRETFGRYIDPKVVQGLIDRPEVARNFAFFEQGGKLSKNRPEILLRHTFQPGGVAPGTQKFRMDQAGVGFSDDGWFPYA